MFRPLFCRSAPFLLVLGCSRPLVGVHAESSEVVQETPLSLVNGWVAKAKSRLVARGFKQREGVDFSETFAPTVSSSCVRLLSAIACECDLDLCHFDVDQAFVQSDLEEDVFLRLPKGCGDLSGKVVRLNKSLYGLKQASRTWHAHLTTCLKRPGFE